MATAFDQLKDFLREMFQFDEHDLDFGIYKVLRLKRRYIERFIEGDGPEDLRAVVTTALAGARRSSTEASRAWLSGFASRFGDMGRQQWEALAADPADATTQEDFRKLFTMPGVEASEKEQAESHLRALTDADTASAEHLEAKVYNYLLNFFELYYAHGDFGYNTRAANAFKIPYEADYDGADTLFHWKHKDSYYIKTGNGFHSVKCDLMDKSIEFRVEAGGDPDAETGEQNNNKDTDIKHYRLDRIEEHDGVWQVIFHLAAASTPKTDLYPRIWREVLGDDSGLERYLYKKPGNGDTESKPVFNDLIGDYDKTEGGQIRGISQLRLKADAYFKELAKSDAFQHLGRNADARAEALKADPVANALHRLDRQLNKFYVGNDADYFIHKDLKGFLTREKDRFIKNVIFSDLGTLLNAAQDTTTVIIARAFNDVATRIIEFLNAIETFQRGLFTLKKKVVDTNYLISVGKIPEQFWPRIIQNKAQIREWKSLFRVDLAESAQLAEHPTLVVDTRHFMATDKTLADEILGDSAFDNLDEKTNGLIIVSENWQALSLLRTKYVGRVTSVYNDPPYNTGKDEFLYKDSFRHSSWASFIFDRYSMFSELLAENGIVFTSIDRNELRTLLAIERSIFSEANDIGTIIWRNARDNNPTRIAIEHEYVTCFAKSTESAEATWKNEITSGKELLLDEYNRLKHQGLHVAEIQRALRSFIRNNLPLLKEVDRYKFVDEEGVYTGSQSVHNPHKGGYEYEIIHPETNRPMVSPANGYRFPWETMKKDYIDKGRLLYGPDENRIVQIKVYLHEHSDSLRSVIDLDGRLGSYALRNLFGDSKLFTNPKPPQLIARLIGFGSKEDSIVLDGFAGSGSTIQAVFEFNKQSKNHAHRFICFDFSKAFADYAIDRCKRLMYSLNWSQGSPAAGSVDGSPGIVKVQTLEQYEDILASLESEWDKDELPRNVPVRYLFRPEQNKLLATLDLSRPFTQTIRVGKKRELKTIDIMETWCYLQGHWIKSRRVYHENDRRYLAVETTQGTLVVFRDINDREDDTDALNAMIDRYVNEAGEPTVQRLEVNHDAQLGGVAIRDVYFVTTADFDRGADWN